MKNNRVTIRQRYASSRYMFGNMFLGRLSSYLGNIEMYRYQCDHLESFGKIRKKLVEIEKIENPYYSYYVVPYLCLYNFIPMYIIPYSMLV